MPESPAPRVVELSPSPDACSSTVPSSPRSARAASRYAPPTITVLGSLDSLTQGGLDLPDDGMGGAGETGSI